MGAFAEFERSLILERQREGIALAKAKNAYKGRKPCMNQEQIEKLHSLVQSGIQKTKLAQQFGVSRDTLYKYLRKDS
ncbi:recombinase family protein [Cardinium endosymbiont of Philonthus spinipes]|uniref:helix-turn-helix domain-containing protein n=1 Tax=Cardinium endosymbiont of Philonthus spinipes TaxID=3077941 RepID=UPI003CC7A859